MGIQTELARTVEMDNRRSNKFYEEEVDDDEFLTHPKSGSAGYMLPNTQSQVRSTNNTSQFSNNSSQQVRSHSQDLDQQRQMLAERRRELEERTLASSERGLGLLYES